MLWRLGRFLHWLCLFCALLSGVILAVFASVWLYRLDIVVLKIPQLVHMTPQVILKNYRQMLSYVMLPWVTTLHMSQFPSSFNGTQHFTDVKRLVQWLYLIFLVTGGISWQFIHWLRQRQQLWLAYRPLQVMIWIPVMVAGLMGLGFQNFFIQFHELLFRNQDWLFDPRLDPIIVALPEAYFMHCFLLGITLLLLLLGGGLWWSHRSLPYLHQKRSPLP